jgi:hypothetical protein
MGSQQPQTLGDAHRCPAGIRAVQRLGERFRATPSDDQMVTGGQGVAGSYPAVPTGRGYFSNVNLLAGEPKGEPISFGMTP